MIIREFFRTRKDKVKLFRTSSDSGKMVTRNDGVEYDEAIDVESTHYSYKESDNPIIQDPEEEGP